MAAEQSDKSKLKSRYGGGFVAPAQYLAELMCERQARSKGQEIPAKFWNLPTWKRTFLVQVRFAHGLFKSYDVQAVLRALESSEGKNIYSLNAKWLDPIIKQEQLKLERIQVQKELQGDKPQSMETAKNDNLRPSFVRKKSTIDKLRELDGEE